MTRIYASSPVRRTWQIVGDLACVAWLALWIWIAKFFYDLVNKLAVPGQLLESSGSGLSGGADKLPSVLKSVGGPFDSLGNGISNAGSAQIAAVHDLAWFVAILVVVMPTVLPIAMHIFLRVRWAIAANAVMRLHRSPQFDHLLAQRALARQPLHKLAAAVGQHELPPGERDQRLAQLELKELGLGR